MKTREPGRLRLAIVATHPIQYHVPIYRALANDPEIEIRVFFASDHSVRGGMDVEFGRAIAWDIPLLEGYPHEFLENRPRALPPRWFHQYSAPSLSGKIANGGFDAMLVPGYMVALYWQAIGAAMRAKIPILMRGDNSDGTGVQRPRWKQWARNGYLRTLYRHVAAGLAVGSYMQRHFQRLGMPAERIFSSPHCVDNTFFRSRLTTAPDAAATRRALGLEQCDAVAMFCGKLVPVKAVPVLAGAITAMTHKKRLGLLVVGDGEMRAQMEQLIARSGIGASAFVGFKNQSELPTYYKAADFLVLPSFSETWGLVVNEAMNCAIPAIVSDSVGCAEDLIDPGKTGYTFPVGDSLALAKILDELTSTPGLAHAMGPEAQRRIDAFGPDAAVAGIKEALVAVNTSRHYGPKSHS